MSEAPNTYNDSFIDKNYSLMTNHLFVFIFPLHIWIAFHSWPTLFISYKSDISDSPLKVHYINFHPCVPQVFSLFPFSWANGSNWSSPCELDIGSWYVTHLPNPLTHPELSIAGSLKQVLLLWHLFNFKIFFPSELFQYFHLFSSTISLKYFQFAPSTLWWAKWWTNWWTYW